ncbi:putative vegetative cell wall protein gp1 protein [Phaeoacremonium minimum UCRPA7]|uniref:Putative vegetative cell wall protein gp1 protein n=1 Tax=Phaeoacremonium minimum (strain UCR-PA7) TaxID=1286976 RepID=R8BVQ0_PHAM7|nr:putative vegetative cell wall protein gp1 protein [Phaeoacremonium minimum UCRPA7]EOO03354.1 putative vegetative cell wall protein gp1 protein [Phaeoacremonium minimum UCRPA7]
MNSYSPYGSTPSHTQDYRDYDKFASPSPTPSPRGPHQFYNMASHQQRPATRAHFRNMSSGLNDFSSPRPAAFSPRYTSDGLYATANVSASRSSRKQSFSSGSRPKTRERRNSFSYWRASDSYGESDEDEYIEINGIMYMLPARSRSKRYKDYYSTTNAGGVRGTDHPRYAQGSPYRPEHVDRDPYESPRYQEEQRRPTAHHSRRGSTSIPQRPQTARPASSHTKKPPAAPKATEADAKKHRIPPGYSLKNWDPTEEPIMLLGSVFDANSLGKWIYDWTVYHHGPSTPISDMAGEMWLLLIQLAGKVKRAEDSIPKIRALENKEMVEDFIESGERLTDKLRKLLKACETPMLKSSKKKDSQLGKNAGIEFVETMFGRERELEKTERFMQSVRLWNLRFDANCEDILKRPTQ